MKTSTRAAQAKYRKLADEELVYQYTSHRDNAAMICLFERYGHVVFGLFMNKTKSAGAAERATRELFIKLSEDLAKFRVTQFKTWLFRQVNNYNSSTEYQLIAENIVYDDADLPMTDRKGRRSPEMVDKGACFTKKQMQTYLTGAMTSEEIEAAKVHLSNCSFCSDALHGCSHHANGSTGLVWPSAAFLKEYFSLRDPHIHLNSLTMTHTLKARTKARRRQKNNSGASRALVGALLIVVAFGLWYFEVGKHLINSSQLQLRAKQYFTARKSGPETILIKEKSVMTSAPRFTADNKKKVVP